MVTKKGKDLLLGMSIGDGHVRRNANELCIAHSIKQKEYVKYKAKLLSKELGREIKVHEKHYGNNSIARFTIGDIYLKKVRKILYPNGTKRLTLDVLNKLTDEAVAIWYMDDGSLYPKKGPNGKIKAYELTISTYCETENEALLIADFFYQKYTLSLTLKRHIGKYSLRCGTQEARSFLPKIDKYSAPGMEYKFNIPPKNERGKTFSK